MTNTFRKIIRISACTLLVLGVAVAAVAGWGWWKLRGTLPQLNGQVGLAGLSAPVEVTRDSAGVPTIKANDRLDLARALGFLHAQDRFFQMDLGRRRASGELAALLGPRAVARDRLSRPHDFRALAREVLQRIPPEQRAVAEAYTAGVNSGLSCLRTKPFEYFLTGSDPAPWTIEDVILTIYCLALDLQGFNGKREYSAAILREQLGSRVFSFLQPLGSEWDAPLDATKLEEPALPAAEDLNVRTPRTKAGVEDNTLVPAVSQSSYSAAGSNNFALSGRHTASQIPLLAGDMHLGLRVPNTWYRVQMTWPKKLNGGENRIVGITVPGLPFIVTGSNGRVAWTFTNSYVDSTDLVIVEPGANDRLLYRLDAHHLAPLEPRTHAIRVRGRPPEMQVTSWTRWGPIIGSLGRSRLLALRWSMHDPDAIDLGLMHLETAETASEALQIARDSGSPCLNILAVDRDGQMGWTICGKVPRRVGWDGRLPTSWTDGQHRWAGYWKSKEIPEILNPPSGRLWTANNRVVGGDALARLGYGHYDLGARATQIRDELARLENAKPEQLLAIQLDDRARFLERWQRLLLAVLDAESLRRRPERERFRSLVEAWGGRATPDSAGYNLVRNWRDGIRRMVFEPIWNHIRRTYPDFDASLLELEPALWAILEKRPIHLLDARFANWGELMVRAVDDIIDEAARRKLRLEDMKWGHRNTAAISHPLAGDVPLFAAFLSMPREPLGGDDNMPRIQGPAFGASNRIVVSPGREEEGLFTMPGGQSGNPLSPFFRDGHSQWVEGQPGRLLPGPAAHTLQLVPAIAAGK